MVRSRTFVLVIVLAIACAGCDWWQWGGNPEHRASNVVQGLTKTSATSWVASRVVDLPTSSPVVTAAGLGFVEQDGRLVAFDLVTYAIVWDAVLPDGSTADGTPAINAAGAATTIFVPVAGTSNPVLLGFDVDGVRNCNPILRSCAPVFTAALGSTVGPVSPVVIDGGRVFAKGADALYAFDVKAQTNCTTTNGTATCTPLWSTPAGPTVSGIGPTASGGLVFDSETAGSDPALRAYNASNGALQWTGTLSAPATATPSIGGNGRVFAPAGPSIPAFPVGGCAAPTCAPQFDLVKRAADPDGDFLATPAYNGSTVVSTNANGLLSVWSTSCASASCEPTLVVDVNTPGAGSTDYRQSPVIASGIIMVLAARAIEGADHMMLLAIDPANGAEVKSWDFGAAGFGAGLANPSVANDVVYAPIDGALFAIHALAIQPLAALTVSPLTLSPAFAPSTFDYVVRCAAGTNSITLDMTATPGGTVGLTAPTATTPSASQSATVPLTPNQAAVIKATDASGRSAEYWIRCLPPDFPAMTVATHPENGSATPGWYLLGNNILSPGTASYAMILDANGTPVWYKRSSPAPALNVTPTVKDRVALMSTLAFFGFTTDPNAKYDEYTLSTGGVQPIRTFGIPPDLHELYTQPNGNHLLLSYPLKSGVDLTGLAATPTPGPNSTIADCVVQQLDPQGQLLWQWTASDHIDPVTETTVAPSTTIGGQTVYDVFHCNSIDVNAAGDVLVSARHLNAVFEVRRSDGKVVWKLGGKPTNKDNAAIMQIQFDLEGGPVQQHDARYLPDNHIGMFDNQSPETGLPARGIEYSLNFSTNTAEPSFSFASQERGPSCCMGSYRRSPDGHRVIGWGYMISNGRVMTEINADAAAVLDISMPTGTGVYRAVKVAPTFYKIATLRSTAGT